jgi:hypothetical protein
MKIEELEAIYNSTSIKQAITSISLNLTEQETITLTNSVDLKYQTDYSVKYKNHLNFTMRLPKSFNLTIHVL